MPDQEFSLILNHTVRITRRSGYTQTNMGQRRSSSFSEIGTGISCYYFMSTGKRTLLPTGDFKNVDFVLMMQPTQDIQEGDIVYTQSGISGFTMSSVMNVEPIMDFDGNTHHIEVNLEKLG